MDKTYFLYRYVRLDKNVPFYIGIGTCRDVDKYGYQVKSHKIRYYRAYSTYRNSICKGIMEKHGYEVEVMYETNDVNHISDKEKEFIKLYGIVYDGSGTLVNLTKGGNSGYSMTEEHINNLVASRIKNNTYKGVNKKPVYMYSLDGSFIDSLTHNGGFYEKFRRGSISGSAISKAITKKISCNTYFFAKEKYDNLDISKYRLLDQKRLPIIKLKDGIPIKIYSSLYEAAKSVGVHNSTLGRSIKNGRLINGFSFKKSGIHELPEIYPQ